MTLIEVLVALAIMGLMVGSALQFIGPWLTRERQLEREGGFWREAQTAQIAVAELAAGAIDPADHLSVSGNAVVLRTYVPRLAATPIDVRLETRHGPKGDELLAESSQLPATSAPLLTGAPLRLRVLTDARGTAKAIIVDARVAGAWSPVIVAPVAANAPSTCIFDIISLVCR